MKERAVGALISVANELLQPAARGPGNAQTQCQCYIQPALSSSSCSPNPPSEAPSLQVSDNSRPPGDVPWQVSSSRVQVRGPPLAPAVTVAISGRCIINDRPALASSRIKFLRPHCKSATSRLSGPAPGAAGAGAPSVASWIRTRDHHRITGTVTRTLTTTYKVGALQTEQHEAWQVQVLSRC
jgi:hypothetical protein